MIERLPIEEAAERLGVSAKTVKRRIKAGELIGHKQSTAQCFVGWMCPLTVRSGDTDLDATLRSSGSFCGRLRRKA
jgi:predicted DNA-binding protein (UPF0251 family)